MANRRGVARASTGTSTAAFPRPERRNYVKSTTRQLLLSGGTVACPRTRVVVGTYDGVRWGWLAQGIR
jgi:hypothetical protein